MFLANHTNFEGSWHVLTVNDVIIRAGAEKVLEDRRKQSFYDKRRVHNDAVASSVAAGGVEETVDRDEQQPAHSWARPRARYSLPKTPDRGSLESLVVCHSGRRDRAHARLLCCRRRAWCC